MLLQMSLDLPDEAASVPLCRKAVRSVLRELSVEEGRAFEIELAVSEAAANVIRHAYAQPGNRYLVSIKCFPDRVLLQVADQGQGFARADVPHPDEERSGGRGLWIIEQVAHVATVRRVAGGGSLLEAEFRLSEPIMIVPDAAITGLADGADSW
jgi:serine/threonine-protein kinase RsbW